VYEDVDSDSSTGSSSDGAVDAILERSLPISATAGGLPLDMQELCVVARKLLQSPGVQREICCAALEDPEVFGILASKVDLVRRAALHSTRPTLHEGHGLPAVSYKEQPGRLICEGGCWAVAARLLLTRCGI
jgi:hypothetical protein